jgi:hypothetical protein
LGGISGRRRTISAGRQASRAARSSGPDVQKQGALLAENLRDGGWAGTSRHREATSDTSAVPFQRRIDPVQCAHQAIGHGAAMKISDFSCPSCGSLYEVAESLSAEGTLGSADCTVCGGVMDSWREPKLRAYRLVLSPEHKYPRIPAPPSPRSGLISAGYSETV